MRSGVHRLNGAGNLDALLRSLDSDFPAERGRARGTLIHLGRQVVPRLIEALRGPSGRLRWEAARALTAIRDPAAAQPLVEALEDDTMEVRWAAENGIIDLGEEGFVALLHGLVSHSGSNRFREAAHRILTVMARGEETLIAAPVLEALEGPAPIAAAPVAAFTALSKLKPLT